MSAQDRAVCDFTQMLAYHMVSVYMDYMDLAVRCPKKATRFNHSIWADHFGGLPFLASRVWVDLWLNCISSVEIILFLLPGILLQYEKQTKNRSSRVNWNVDTIIISKLIAECLVYNQNVFWLTDYEIPSSRLLKFLRFEVKHLPNISVCSGDLH